MRQLLRGEISLWRPQSQLPTTSRSAARGGGAESPLRARGLTCSLEGVGASWGLWRLLGLPPLLLIPVSVSGGAREAWGRGPGVSS